MDPDVVHWIPVPGGKILKAPHSLKGTRGTDEHTKNTMYSHKLKCVVFFATTYQGDIPKKKSAIFRNNTPLVVNDRK